MKNRFFIIFFYFLFIPFSLLQAREKNNTIRKSFYGFIENKGQIIDQNYRPNPGVLYLLNSPGLNIQIRKFGFSYDLYTVSKNTEGNRQQAIGNSDIGNPASCIRHPASGIQYRVSSIQYHRIDFDLMNANPDPVIETSEPSLNYLNYYTAGTPLEGATFVHSFQTITYKDIYPDIDLEFLTGPDSGFKYNFVIWRGVEPRQKLRQ